MKKELQDKLFNTYPEFFIQKSWQYPRISLMLSKIKLKFGGSPVLPTLLESLMGFGFGCGDGWYDLLNDLFRKIKIVNRGPYFQITQVKEKFGTLRIYHNGSDIIDDLVEVAGRKSGQTCEECGSHGKLRGKGWLVTLCDKHWEEGKRSSKDRRMEARINV